MNQEKVLAALEEARRVHPDMSYDDRWNLVTASQSAIPGDLGDEARKIQASTGMTFEESWDELEREALPHLRKGLTVGQALVLARKAKPELPTLDFDEWFADVEKRQASRVEADRVPEHPFQAEANRRGLLLIEGGFCNPIC